MYDDLTQDMAAQAAAAAAAGVGVQSAGTASSHPVVQPPPAVVQPAAVVGNGGAGPRPPMRWNNGTSSFMLRRMSELITTGVRTDKGFKEVHLNQVAKALQEFTGEDVSGTQVYNHLRKWRQRWIKVTKLRELSGALWDEEHCMITLEDEHYNGHVKVGLHLALYNLIYAPLTN